MKTKTQQPSQFFTASDLHPSRWLWLAALACCAAGQLWAATTTIVSDDFESYTGAATSLTDTSDADPLVPNGVIPDDNPVGGVDGSGVQLINWLAHSGSQSLLLRSGSEAQLQLVNARSGSSYTLDFWVYAVREPTSSQNFYVILRGEGSDFNGQDYLAYQVNRATNSTVLRYYDGVGPSAPNWINTTANQATDRWQHHRLVINPNALTFSLYVDDMTTSVVSDVEISRSEVAVPTLLRVLNEGNSADDGYFAIDDVSLTVENAIDLTGTFTDGFETYPARTTPEDDADPQGPWITTETDGTASNGAGKSPAPVKVQVVNSSVVTPHSGTNCLKLEYGQRAGASIAWGVPPQSDVQITWWARVPASVAGTTANYLRMSLYGAENGDCLAGDNALLGYGSRQAGIGDETSLTYYLGSGWLDTAVDYTPDTWEQYRLITHTSQGLYTIMKDPSGANPQVVVDRKPFIGSAANWSPVFMAAWSSSNGTNHPPVYIDDIEIKSLASTLEPLGEPYAITNYGTRFTNWTVLTANAPVGKPVVDPRDTNTILFTTDIAGGGIYRARKVASGNWAIDPQPIVGGLDRPSGLAIENNGTIWWTHDYNNDFTRSLARLKAPWASNTVETIIADIGDPLATTRDDDAIDVTVAPATFSGVYGQPGMIVVADRGVDGDANNAVYLVDPATTLLDQVGYNNFLVNPTPSLLGNNLDAIASLPASGEVVTLSTDGYLVAVDGNGVTRNINAFNLWPLGGSATGQGIAVDPTTAKIWATDDILDEIWSVDAASGADQREIGFPLTDPLRTDRQIDFHDPGLGFAPDGSFMVVTDTSMSNGGGGRLIIFHNEPFALPSFAITSVNRVAEGWQVSWQSAGAAKYRLQRGSTLTDLQDITGDLTVTQFTDTNNVGNVFYRVVAK
ncbi:MAG TPA: hypothetical protein VJA21_22080 [Verrucomicrobiae bacterium]